MAQKWRIISKMKLTALIEGVRYSFIMRKVAVSVNIVGGEKCSWKEFLGSLIDPMNKMWML